MRWSCAYLLLAIVRPLLPPHDRQDKSSNLQPYQPHGVRTVQRIVSRTRLRLVSTWILTGITCLS